MLRWLLILLTSVPLVSPAAAFETAGFRSGMSVAEFTAAAKARDLEPAEVDLGVAGMRGFELQPSGGQPARTVSFCGDRLASVTEGVDGGFEGFAAALEEAQKTMEDGRVEGLANPAPKGTFARVVARWDGAPGETFSVTMTSYLDQVSVTQGWDARLPECP